MLTIESRAALNTSGAFPHSGNRCLDCESDRRMRSKTGRGVDPRRLEGWRLFRTRSNRDCPSVAPCRSPSICAEGQCPQNQTEGLRSPVPPSWIAQCLALLECNLFGWRRLPQEVFDGCSTNSPQSDYLYSISARDSRCSTLSLQPSLTVGRCQVRDAVRVTETPRY